MVHNHTFHSPIPSACVQDISIFQSDNVKVNSASIPFTATYLAAHPSNAACCVQFKTQASVHQSPAATAILQHNRLLLVDQASAHLHWAFLHMGSRMSLLSLISLDQTHICGRQENYRHRLILTPSTFKDLVPIMSSNAQ